MDGFLFDATTNDNRQRLPRFSFLLHKHFGCNGILGKGKWMSEVRKEKNRAMASLLIFEATACKHKRTHRKCKACCKSLIQIIDAETPITNSRDPIISDDIDFSWNQTPFHRKRCLMSVIWIIIKNWCTLDDSRCLSVSLFDVVKQIYKCLLFYIYISILLWPLNEHNTRK